MIVYTIQNIDTGDFYSESPALKDEARRTGQKWENASILPCFAKRYTRRKDALRRSRELAKQSSCVFDVIPVNTEVPKC